MTMQLSHLIEIIWWLLSVCPLVKASSGIIVTSASLSLIMMVGFDCVAVLYILRRFCHPSLDKTLPIKTDHLGFLMCQNFAPTRVYLWFVNISEDILTWATTLLLIYFLYIHKSLSLTVSKKLAKWFVLPWVHFFQRYNVI